MEQGSPVDRCSWLACASAEPIVVFQEAIKTDEDDPVMDLLGPGCHVTHQARREADGERYATATPPHQLVFQHSRPFLGTALPSLV